MKVGATLCGRPFFEMKFDSQIITETVGREQAPAVCYSRRIVDIYGFSVGNAVLSVPLDLI